MILDPSHYSDIPVRELLHAAAAGTVSIDHRFLHAVLDRQEETIKALLEFRDREDCHSNIDDVLIALCRHFRNPAVLPFLDNLQTESDESREQIEDAIESLKAAQPAPFDIWSIFPETAPPDFGALSSKVVEEFLSSPAPDHRAEAAAWLSAADLDLSNAVRDRLFALALHDPDTHVRTTCWESLFKAAKDPQIRQAMLRVISNTQAPLEERGGALTGLASLSDDPELRKWMLEFYGVPESRASALKAMANSCNPAFNEYLLKHLEDPEIKFREQAIFGVGNCRIASAAHRLPELFDHPQLRGPALYSYALAIPAEITQGGMRRLFKRIDELAGGLDDGETAIVEESLDLRLIARGKQPVFTGEGYEDADEAIAPVVAPARVGRNDPCPCGSGRKYKKCCGAPQ